MNFYMLKYPGREIFQNTTGFQRTPVVALKFIWLNRNNQSLKGAVGTTLCQNEAELKLSMEMDHHTSSTDQAGKIRLPELIINDIYLPRFAVDNQWWVSLVSLIFPACSVSEIWWRFALEIVLLPHSDRVSQQLLLSIPETSVPRHSNLDTYVICFKVCLNRYSWGAGKLGSEDSSWFRRLGCISWGFWQCPDYPNSFWFSKFLSWVTIGQGQTLEVSKRPPGFKSVSLYPA